MASGDPVALELPYQSTWGMAPSGHVVFCAGLAFALHHGLPRPEQEGERTVTLAILDDTTEQHAEVQLAGSAVVWSLEEISLVIAEARKQQPDDVMRSMYSRLAREYDAEPVVSSRGGGLQGDRFPF